MSMCSEVCASKVRTAALTRSDLIPMVLSQALNAVSGASQPMWELLGSYASVGSIGAEAQIRLLSSTEDIDERSAMSSHASNDRPSAGHH